MVFGELIFAKSVFFLIIHTAIRMIFGIFFGENMLKLEDVHGKPLIINKLKVVKVEGFGNKTRIFIEGQPLPVITNYNFNEISEMMFGSGNVN